MGIFIQLTAVLAQTIAAKMFAGDVLNKNARKISKYCCTVTLTTLATVRYWRQKQSRSTKFYEHNHSHTAIKLVGRQFRESGAIKQSNNGTRAELST